MIKYDLTCRKDHKFEGWFGSSSAFDEQAASGALVCPICNSRKIAKAPMAPSVSKSAGAVDGVSDPARLRDALVKLRKHVESTAEHVGDRFAEEVRAIHYGDADERPIYGETTVEEGKALKDEGIPVTAIPWVPLGDA